jgi:hypothetical protein
MDRAPVWPYRTIMRIPTNRELARNCHTVEDIEDAIKSLFQGHS